MKEFVEACKKATGVDIKVDYLPRRPGDYAEVFSNPTKIKNELNWTAQHTDLQESLSVAWRWQKSHLNGYGNSLVMSSWRTLMMMEANSRKTEKEEEGASTDFEDLLICSHTSRRKYHITLYIFVVYFTILFVGIGRAIPFVIIIIIIIIVIVIVIIIMYWIWLVINND